MTAAQEPGPVSTGSFSSRHANWLRYSFEGPNGQVGLLDLFEGRPQLIMHHFMWLCDIDADGAEHPRDTGLHVGGPAMRLLDAYGV